MHCRVSCCRRSSAVANVALFPPPVHPDRCSMVSAPHVALLRTEQLPAAHAPPASLLCHTQPMHRPVTGLLSNPPHPSRRTSELVMYPLARGHHHAQPGRFTSCYLLRARAPQSPNLPHTRCVFLVSSRDELGIKIYGRIEVFHLYNFFQHESINDVYKLFNVILPVIAAVSSTTN